MSQLAIRQVETRPAAVTGDPGVEVIDGRCHGLAS